jgi:gliding motility-associated-like protein
VHTCTLRNGNTAYMKAIPVTILLILTSLCANAQITGIKVTGDTCNTYTATFTAEGTTTAPYLFWSFGDPASGNRDTVTVANTGNGGATLHKFFGGGVYNVCVTPMGPGIPAVRYCRTVAIALCCNSLISSGDTCLLREIPFFVTTGATINSISWNFGDPSTGASNTSSLLNPVHKFSAVGNYAVTATIQSPCGQIINTFIQPVVNCAPLSCTAEILFNDSCLKKGANFQIQASYPVNAVTWHFDDPLGGNTNNTNIIATHKYSATGIFNVSAEVELSCGLLTIYKTINIVDCDAAAPCKGTINLLNNCAGMADTFSITAAYPVNSVTWNFNDPSSGTNNTATGVSTTHTFATPGSYLVSAAMQLGCGNDTVLKSITINNCDTATNSNCKLFVPGIFTPNADNLNDSFRPLAYCNFLRYQFMVYNRLGQQVFSSKNPADKWNGSFNGIACPPGGYVYLVNYQFAGGLPQKAKGSVVLVR